MADEQSHDYAIKPNQLGAKLEGEARTYIAFKISPLEARRASTAVVETTEGAELSLRVLKRHLSESLPAYMAPETLEIVTELPKTSTGKVDRQALKAATDLEPAHP